MSIKTGNLHFFNKKGDNLNLFFDSVSGLYRGNYVLSEKPVSVELIESEQIIILEKVFSEQYQTFKYVKPTTTLDDESEFIFEIDRDSEDTFFTFDITLDDDKNYYINKDLSQVIESTYDSSFTDVDLDGTIYTNIPNSYDINKLREDYNTANIGFSASTENSYVGKVNIYITNQTEKSQIAEIFFFVDTIAEDTRLPLLLETLGHTINTKDFLIFDTTNVNEEEIDFNIVNKKRKELLLEFHNIFPYLGSYKALINIVKFFGYESLSIKEYWQNVKADSENFGKKRPVDIESVLLNSNNSEELADLFPSKVFRKTNTFGMYYQITEETGEFDEDGLPITEETFDFTIDEILVKLYALKDKLKKYFLPLNSRIIDIVGEALYYTKVEINYWQSFNRVDDVSININPTFEVSPSKYGFIEDLRPLEWVGAKIGPDLLLDGTTELDVREFTLTNSFFNNTLRIFDAISGVGYEIVAEYESTDESNMRRLYEGLIKLGAPFNEMYINLDGNKILFVERYKTTSDFQASTEQGQFAGTPPSLTFEDYLNGEQPIENYGNAYLQYFFDRSFNILNLDNNEDIPVGYPIILKNTSFDVNWDSLDVTWNLLDEKHNYNDFNFSDEPGFPSSDYNNGDDPFSGISWDDIGNSNFYEIEWFIYKNKDDDTPYWEASVKGNPKDFKEWSLNLPYAGEYTVELTLYDMYGSFSRNKEVSYITVEQKQPNFTAWKIMDLYDITWDDLDDITWDNMNSTWDLPFLPNSLTDDSIITWHSIDRVEFYQNLVKQDALLRSKGDINSQTWKNLGDKVSWEDLDHVYWDELSPTFTKFYISEIGPTSQATITVFDEVDNPLESFTFSRNNNIQNQYHDFIDQIYDLNQEDYPILTSFIYEYRPIVSFGQPTIQQIVAVSKQFDKPKRYFFKSQVCEISSYTTPLNGYGAIGDSSACFDIYGSSLIQGYGATSDGIIAIDNISYTIPNSATSLSLLNDDLNNNSPFGEWEFNIVKSYQGATGDLRDEKIIASKINYTGDDIHNIKYSNVFGTKYARSITTNATWTSLDVLYYQRDVKPYTQIYFNYDISKMPGFKNPKWKISKVDTGEVIFEWLNKYMVYLFTDEGEYTISLELEDTNGNKKTIAKNGLVRIVSN